MAIEHEKSVEFFRKHAVVDKNSATLGQKDTLAFFNENGVPDSVLKRVVDVQSELVTAAYAFTAEQLEKKIKEKKENGASNEELAATSFVTKCRVPDQTIEVSGCGMRKFRDPRNGEKSIEKYFPATAVTRVQRQISSDVVSSCVKNIQRLFD